MNNSKINITKLSLLIIIASFISCKEVNKDNAKDDKPLNVVFILADDMGWNQVKYHKVTNYYDTPNIDGLASSGMIFTNAYAAAPICSPARASIMTGKYPARLHLTDYLPGNSYPYAPLLSAEQTKEGLSMEEVTLAEMFKTKGYATGHFGKWHLNKDKNYKINRPGDPKSQGFDDVLATVKPEPDSNSKDAHHVGQITDRTIQFIENNKDKPFFAYVSHHVVHRPIMEDQDLINSYKTKQHNENKVNNPIMGAMIERMDRSIGRILDKLEELNLTDNTIIVFFSDNGGFKYYQDQAPLRGGKAMVFEGGIRVPFAIKWPGVIKPGSVSDIPMITNDFFPTLAEIIGATSNNEDIDGISLVPILKDEKFIERDALFWYFPHYHRQGYKPSGAVRVGDYKLIEWYEHSLLGKDYQYSLYNVKNDIGESNNLAKEMPDLVIEMKNRLHKWLKDVGANKMKVNPNFDSEKRYLPELEWPEGKDYHYIDMHFPNRQ
jgi:arylsulfatase A-like enzyme